MGNTAVNKVPPDFVVIYLAISRNGTWHKNNSTNMKIVPVWSFQSISSVIDFFQSTLRAIFKEVNNLKRLFY